MSWGSDAFLITDCGAGDSTMVDKVISYMENKNTGSLGKTICVLWRMMVAITPTDLRSEHMEVADSVGRIMSKRGSS